MRSLPGICLLLLLLAITLCPRAQAQPPTPSTVNVILWFDTEDYLSPSDDDAAKRLADLLTARHIRATFKVVGEKARVLEQRHRIDVIESLNRHDIGFHGNFHSVHPTVSEYEADLGLLDGMAEFIRREGPGAADVRRIFGRKSLACYGQPGSSWAAQAIAALGQCGVENDGIPCYLDSGQHVGIGGAPFWYAGALVVYKMRPNETRMELFTPGGLEEGEKQFAAIAQRLQSAGGGLISIFYHPCEWVTSQFWDSANFAAGANPPRDQWKLPTQRPVQETEAAFHRFEQYVDFMCAQPDVSFVTASQLPALYPNALRTQGASPEELTEIARRLTAPEFSGLDDVNLNEKLFSPADQFDLLAAVLADIIEGNGAHPTVFRIESPLGPDSRPSRAIGTVRDPVPWSAFSSAALDMRDYIKSSHRVPSQVFIGSNPVAPADFLVGLAAAFLDCRQSGRFPSTVRLGHDVPVLTERFVAKDDGRLFSGWIIHPPGFRAPHIMDIARLQAWTFKPAVRAAAKAQSN